MTALVIDDDQTIRSIVRAVLTNRSYRVLEAVDMEEALAVCGQHHGVSVAVAGCLIECPCSGYANGNHGTGEFIRVLRVV